MKTNKELSPRISKAIDIFLDAINNGTLAKGSCSACAVGNLVANGIGYEINDINYHYYIERTLIIKPNTYWSLAFSTNEKNIQKIDFDLYTNDLEVKENIDSTDFTFHELALIENTFENNTKIYFLEYKNYSKKEIRADQIKGLEAVINVMLTFDNQVKDYNVKEIFTNKLEFV